MDTIRLIGRVLFVTGTIWTAVFFGAAVGMTIAGHGEDEISTWWASCLPIMAIGAFLTWFDFSLAKHVLTNLYNWVVDG